MFTSPRINLLVVNPNTSTYITDDLKAILDQLDYPGVDFDYYTSASGPSILASTADLHASTAHTLGPVLELADQYDGVLIACYADHPLTSLLQRHLTPKPVVGIFEASVVAAMRILSDLDSRGTFGIVTTGQFYEAQLTHGVHRMLDQEVGKQGAVFAGVQSTGISPERLKTESPERIRRRVEAATKRLLLQDEDVEVICMGGVILAGMEDWVRRACEAELGVERGSRVVVVDQMAAGVESLISCAAGVLPI